MSAQAVLSMIAPSLTAIPQGSTGGVDASGFEGVLAGMLTSGAAKADALASALADTAETDAADVGGASTVAPGFLIAPTPLPLPIQSAPATEGTAVPTPDAAPAAELPASSVIAPPAQAPAASAEVAGKPVAPLAPQVLPPEPSVTAPIKQTAQTTPPASAEPTEQAAPAAEGDPAVVTAAAVASTTKAATEALVSLAKPEASKPEPAPLRPLAERGSKAPDTNALTAEAPAPGDARGAQTAQAAGQPAASAASAQAPANDQPTKAAEASPVAAAAADPASMDEADPLAASSEPSATQSTSAVREAAVAPSNLSRVTIDATAQIAAQIIRKLDARSTRFEMALLPEELGRVDVKLDIDSEGRLQARLAFDNPAAATDLKGRADELRRQLEQQGFQLADDAFEFAERDSNSSAFDRGQDARHGQGRAFAAASRLNNDADAVQPRWTSLSLTPAGVDMKV